MSERGSSRADKIIELVIEELRERLAQEQRAAAPADEVTVRTGAAAGPVAAQPQPETTSADEVCAERSAKEGATEGEQSALEAEAEEGQPLPSVGGPHAARFMKRLALWLFVAAVLINIPFNRHGTTLATAMPDAASYVIRDGFVVKEQDDPEIYVYRDGSFRWISSLDAFEHYGYTWGDVHLVPDGYLSRFKIGPPIHVLLKCGASPHIYRLEQGKKRWIRDIDTFVAEGHVWDDVRFVSCDYLRDLPDGETIPPGSGPPPQP